MVFAPTRRAARKVEAPEVDRAAALETDLAEALVDRNIGQMRKGQDDGVDQRLQETKSRCEYANAPSRKSAVDRQRDDDGALAPTSAAHKRDATRALNESDRLAL
jgi:hypothetical protein